MTVAIDVLKQIIVEVGDTLEDAVIAPEDIMVKEGHQNFVTRYDKRVQDMLESRFAELWPEYFFLAEENACNPNPYEGKGFIVDPIDGTSNFIHRIPHSAVSVAVIEEGEVIQGVVYNPFLKELYWAVKGEGAYLNGERLMCPDLPLNLTLFCVGMSPYYSEYLMPTLKLMADLMPHVTDLRRIGAASLDLCYIASGIQGGFCEWRLQPWDHAAGALVASEAGAIVSRMNGEKLPYHEPSAILAAGPKAYERFRALIDTNALLSE